jgi:thioesterase domain-containing protein
MRISDIEALLKKDIPISAEMGVRDFQLDSEGLQFCLPLQPNVNHKGTLFGGSLYSAGALGCYALFLSGLREASLHTNNIVISEGHIQYNFPVEGDAQVIAHWSSLQDRSQFFQTLKSKKKARVQMKAEIWSAGKACALFTGSFVAFLDLGPVHVPESEEH